MAKAGKGIIGKISGSLGNTQFRQTRYGTVLAETTVPVNNWSSAKQDTKARFAYTSRLWTKVKYQDVLAWNRMADTISKTDKLGNEYSMRGIDLFRQINRQLIEINEPVIFTPPKKVFPKALIAPEFEIIADNKILDIRLHFKYPIHKNTKYIIFATHLLNAGINSPKPSWYKKFAVIDSTFLSGFSLLNEYLNVFKLSRSAYPRIGFIIKPVSVISGLTLPSEYIFYCKND